MSRSEQNDRLEERGLLGDEHSRWHAVARTHVGLVRSSNQDRFLLDEQEGGLLCAVADGMGGHAGGERASGVALSVFAEEVAKGWKEGDDIPSLLAEAARRAHEAVREEGGSDPELRGMGTTLVGVMLEETADGSFLNVGDSRLYLYRNGELRRISRDHSLVADLVAKGEITEEEAATHPRRNVLTMALGIDHTFAPQAGPLPVEPGDLLLLASDGLHGMISDRDIARILAADWSLEARCNSLIEAALDAGGRDNVTVLLLARHPKKGATAAIGLPDGGSSWLLVPLILLLVLGLLRLISSDGGFGETVEPYPVDSLMQEVGVETSAGDTLIPDSLRGFPFDRNRRVLDSNSQPTPGDFVGDSLLLDTARIGTGRNHQ